MYAVQRPCSDFMDMLRRPINCHIIIIIIIIIIYLQHTAVNSNYTKLSGQRSKKIYALYFEVSRITTQKHTFQWQDSALWSNLQCHHAELTACWSTHSAVSQISTKQLLLQAVCQHNQWRI